MKKVYRGFTLVELLVVMSIFILISALIVSFLVVVLRGSEKSDSVIIVRQNGKYAMEQMTRAIRFAKGLDYPIACAGGGEDHITINNIDLSQTTFTCPASPPVYPNYINSSDIGALTNSSLVLVESCSFVCSQEIGGPPTITVLFRLSKVNSNGLPEGNTEITFKSAVTLRNYNSE